MKREGLSADLNLGFHNVKYAKFTSNDAYKIYVNKSKFLALYDAISLICSFYAKRFMGRVSSQNLSLRQSKISPSQNVVETLVERGC